mmetsp:Transcript_2999/g.6936  ORF Transcript_2999/g.6936 Transcript_2999/m.6936 type:complete len:256 (-) Transcript_2999:542-1309(-)|eukprot:CAMPEP_0178998538 /NCGR_PEP_ID=MMETSP0795-20121207/9565_1 /TAXON_ID=88552 /ORGANISM="Amoebophrya sp., Strain Ameob2" /LENGTH=255 /DNA_ID=CAMNT_0020691221 /DNA_START=59 /DNA_END=826 /DNA_ORIENTATION=+
MPTTLQARERKAQRKLPEMKEMDKAFDAAKYTAPKFSMRAKTSFGAQIRTKMSESDKTSGPIDIGVVKHENPKYSMRARTCKMLQLPGQSTDSVPGPGAYPVPATTTFDHPCLPMPGRTNMRGPPRFDPNPPSAKTPGPSSYDTKDFYKILSGRPPTFSMRIKPKMGGNINPNWCKGGAKVLDADVNKNRPPVWSMRARTCKMLQLPGQSTDSVPGPGTYPVPATTQFDHPCMKMPGRTKFGSAPRFKDYDPEDC